jgi:hypothetical protein
VTVPTGVNARVSAAQLRVAVRDALPVWFGSRAMVVLLTFVGAWLLPAGDRGADPRFVDVWNHWDVDWFRKNAEHGYFDPRNDPHSEAFFPGMSMAMRLVHTVVPNWIVAGLVVTAVAGAVASVALYLLASQEHGRDAGRRAVLFLVVFPYGVFLFAGYSEPLFLAFATTAWLAARRDAWWWAGLLAAGASTTRITGVALGAALAVEYLSRRGWRGLRRPEVFALALPALPVLWYFTYLHEKTGHWDAYKRALEQGWGRETVAPWTALQNTWNLAHDPAFPTQFTLSFWAELTAMALGVALTATLLWQRRWGEATFVGLNVAILSVSSFYASGVRALMVWFPLYLLLTRVTVSRTWLTAAIVLVCGPLFVVGVLAFTLGGWLG